MLRDGASRLLGMRVRYLILLIGEERAQASVSKDFRSLLVLCLIPIPVERFAGIGLEDESDLLPSANALCGFGITSPVCIKKSSLAARTSIQFLRSTSLHTSITRLDLGLEQQMSTQPGSGSSKGSSRYSTSPSVSSHMHVWQMPDRQL